LSAGNCRETKVGSGATVTVVICTYNRCHLLADCLASMACQGLDGIEVLVIDNNSSDETARVVADVIKLNPSIRYVFEEREGLSYARNRGWLEARGAIVAYIDDDARAAPDWCEKIVSAFSTCTPEPAAVGGPIFPFVCRAAPWWYVPELETRTWGAEAHFLESTAASYGFSGSNMAFKKQSLQDVGGFDPEYGMQGGETRMGEETELFTRLFRVGALLWYDPAIRVSHLVPSSQLSLSGRIKRAFMSGCARQSMAYRRITIRDVCREASGLVRMMMTFYRAKIGFSYFLVSTMDAIANRSGYLLTGLR
jgi:glycosyltransferase involved in cell wall biosynthesis